MSLAAPAAVRPCVVHCISAAVVKQGIRAGAWQKAGKLLPLAFCCALMLLSGPGHAAIVGHSVAAQSLTAERIAALPVAQRGAWMAYLRQSERQWTADQAALAAERAGLAAVPAEPLVGSPTRSMPLKHEAAWYGSAEARHIADVIVSFQTPAGGWGKNLDMSGAPRVRGQSYVADNRNRFGAPDDLDSPRDPAWHYVGTLDNDATTTEMHFLACVQQTTPGTEGNAYRRSFLRGVTYLLKAQYPNGGWPQVWPLEGGYHDAITFNDDAVRNAVVLLQGVALGEADVAFVPEAQRLQAKAAVDRAVQCILAAQVVLHGRKTIWGQQHDMLTLQPVAARNFEPASLASSESAHLLELLMKQPEPTPAVQEAVTDGVTWLQGHSLRNVAVVGGRETPEGRHMVQQAGAGPIWARYYSLDRETPIFGDRDKSIHDAMNEISLERRNGYGWYNSDPAEAIQMYAGWRGGQTRVSVTGKPGLTR